MRVKDTGRGILKEAQLRFHTAEGALQNGNYAYSFRQAQECVELSLKACLRRVGIEYPRVHDVSSALKEFAERFPEWFRSRIDEFCTTSIELAERRDIAMYGDDQEGLAPGKLFNQEDAGRAVAWAREVLDACQRLHAS